MEQPRLLHLDVVINGTPLDIIGTFTLIPGGAIGATRRELESIGLRTGTARPDSDNVMLHELPGLQYVYEERTQRIRIMVDPAGLLPQVFDLRHVPAPDRPRAGWGTVLNYDLFSSYGSASTQQPFAFTGSTLTLDGRAFSPYGTLAQTAIMTLNANQAGRAVRLDSSYRYSDYDRLIAWTIGDTFNGSLPWTRPIRIGGIQSQLNFALRPDLVTMPLPSLSGTAVVPSTVDLFINSVRTFSQDVAAGPFSLANIPTVTGAGNAEMVVRDSSGHQTTTNLPFFASSNLLAPGLSSWSIEAGLPRLSYGSQSDAYTAQPVASATLRRGIWDWFTAEAHAEGGSGLANAGGGLAIRTGTFGIATAAVAGSVLGSGSGLQSALSYDTRLFGFSVNIGSQRTVRDYEDLASATARQQDIVAIPVATPFDNAPVLPATRVPFGNPQLYASFRPPRALDRATVSGIVPFDDKASWSVSFIHEVDATNSASRLIAASYTRSLPHDISLYVTAFHNAGAAPDSGVVVGLIIPLGQSSYASPSVSGGTGGITGTAQVSHSPGTDPGSVGWQVQDTEGPNANRQASLSYRAPLVMVQASANESRTSRTGTLDLTGAIATMGRGIFVANRIDDAFAVVDAGAPGVEVSYENRPVGRTDSHGMLLVPTLRSSAQNRLSLDPVAMPVDTEIETTREVVTPADRSGVLVSFKVHSDATAALVIFARPDGGFMPAGSTGHLDGRPETFIIGYDGQSFLKGLAGSNQVTIDFGDGTCHASFAFKPQPGKQVKIGPVPCR